MKKLTKIADIFNNYQKIKKDFQLRINFDPRCDKFWLYHYKTGVRKIGRTYWRYLKNYFNLPYYYICQ